MPVPWPIPTTTQQVMHEYFPIILNHSPLPSFHSVFTPHFRCASQLGSTTQSTANENKKIQTATKENNGVQMSRSNIENVKKTIGVFLHTYMTQEPVKKKAEDVSAKVYELYEKLDNGAFSEHINENIINLVNYINANDFKTTNKILVDLSRNLWDGTNKSW
ncbi:protein transport protein SEC31 (SEC31) [Plasmodium ovale wallikeri]|uniref:Protein transport protein SEC31 (SEC31) n=1 Tax=Plasmodium ovale wallikeri TaxID=864142 RepID=A0A1A8YJW5_PLAOA|nr:protein transport protein SEC31 (SEC31) [Plasmodium ovale wallikeri]